MGKPIQKPSTHYLREIYSEYAAKVLAAHPTWWGKYDKRFKLRNCYIYEKQGNKLVLKMSWLIWKDAITRYFHKAKDAIIQGETLKLGNVGRLRAIRIQRDFSSPEINWGATFKQAPKPDGTYTKIYYTDEDYCRIQWAKMGTVPNETYYNFTPASKNTGSGKGFKAEFVAALRADPLLKYRFKYYPITRKNKPCPTPIAP